MRSDDDGAGCLILLILFALAIVAFVAYQGIRLGGVIG